MSPFAALGFRAVLVASQSTSTHAKCSHVILKRPEKWSQNGHLASAKGVYLTKELTQTNACYIHLLDNMST